MAMNMLSAALLIVLAGSGQIPPTAPAGGATSPAESSEFTLQAGMDAAEKLRLDGLRAFNHGASNGAFTTPEKITVQEFEGPYKYQGLFYRSAYDGYARPLAHLQEVLKKIMPAEPLARDARRLFGDSSLPSSVVGQRKRVWIQERLRAFDPAWDSAEREIKSMALRLTTKKRSPLEDFDYGRGWQRVPLRKPCRREIDAAELRKKLRAEFERRLAEYWDENREAWIGAESAK
jgi:hypothetical protein